MQITKNSYATPHNLRFSGMGTPTLAAIAFLSLFSTVHSQLAPKKTKTLEFSIFNSSHYAVLLAADAATISKYALQLTPDSASDDLDKRFKSGRVLYNEKFKLWDESSDIVASFNTSFLINIYPINKTVPGEGLTFLICPENTPPPNSDGPFLGLTNSSTDGNATNKIVAVEVDTLKQDFDPDGNHLGINVNGVKSINNVSLGGYNITVAPVGLVARFYNIWVDYDGVDKWMEVYISEQRNKTGPTPAKPGSPILSAPVNLKEHVNQDSYIGFSASTGNQTQLNCILRWNITLVYFSDQFNDMRRRNIAMIGAGVGFAVMLSGVAVLAVCVYRIRRRPSSDPSLTAAVSGLPGTPEEYNYSDLKKATADFDGNNKLGEGGFGVVYRGFLEKKNSQIAVKLFKGIKNKDDFLAELSIINRLRHKNLVTLLGWCHRHGKLLLVYEYLANGSLDNHLFSSNEEPLKWRHRQNIVTHVAYGLHYLHVESKQLVIHRDIKVSNIMLDSNFNAYLGDFGLARALEDEIFSYAHPHVIGTPGYIAPECFHTGTTTTQSDVYAFGVVLLEVVTGLPRGTKIDRFHSLVDWVWFLHREGMILDAVDPRLGEDYDKEEAERLLLLGLACLHPATSDRPKTHTLLQMILSKTVPVPKVPLSRPSFVWPPMGMTELDSYSLETFSPCTSLDGPGRS